jgi:beta-galactosidase
MHEFSSRSGSIVIKSSPQSEHISQIFPRMLKSVTGYSFPNFLKLFVARYCLGEIGERVACHRFCGPSMKLRLWIFAVCLTFAIGAAGATRIITPFDSGWRFFKGDAQGAETAGFNDQKWQTIVTPHDWSIEGPFAAANKTGGGGGFLPAGIGWYRKHFALPKQYAGRRIYVEFDGVMANSDVWINGIHLGKRPYGYISFGYELTGNVAIGNAKNNVLAVRVDNSGQPASRWYTGAGIYRHVRLIAADPVHFVKWKTYITTPRVADAQSIVRVQGAIANQSPQTRDVSVQISIVSTTGKPVGTVIAKPQIIAASQTLDFREELVISNPKLWQLDRPDLYQADLSVRSASIVLDEERTNFGIRDARFVAETGFWLNGKNVKIKGVCLHHDGGAFGAAVPLRAWERRLEQLRELGVNAVRTAHNPPAPEFLDLCDRMGFLVMDELFDCWTIAKTPFDYHLYFNEWAHADVRDTVLRDRNHPCIILYSAGNEIRDTVNADLAKRILAGLVDVFHRFDPSRPVTQGLFRPNVSHDYENGLADLLDVVGTNYRDLELLAAHKDKPSRKIIGTEQRHDLVTWLAARDYVQHAGQFLWSGVDYLGESLQWPVIGAGSGLLDRAGAIKPMAYERQSWWSNGPVVHIVRRTNPAQIAPTDPGFAPLILRQSQFVDWTPVNSGPHEETVEAYSNCEEVELLLNGKSLGGKTRNADDAPRIWKVAWAPGTLKAIGKNHGTPVAEHQLHTAGKAAKIMLVIDRDQLIPVWDDVSFVTAIIIDNSGVPIPDASYPVSFKITGPGIIAAVDNGDNSSVEPFQSSVRRAYQGRCYAMIKAHAARGKITVSASTPGLMGASIVIEASSKKP